ncbi:MAG: hypothetical protein AAGF47_02075 [Planctomycetota bacterium]
MTRPQRRAHLLIWLVAAPAALVLAAIVLLQRDPPARPVAQNPEPAGQADATERLPG